MSDDTLAPAAAFPDEAQTSLDALSEIAATINSVREPARLLETVLEIAMQSLDAERGFVFLEDEDAATGFAVKATRNFTEDELDGVVTGEAEG
ncbi:MAG: hypothetical protein HKN04_07735, partial [Rhodothermaceae bacterium]|nr:hypothetical protein [Rhodothermaceae bacterium]